MSLPLKLHFTIQDETLLSVQAAPAPSLQVTATSHLPLVEEWIAHYLDGLHPTFPLPLAFPHLTPFTQQVLTQLQTIPWGHTTSYSSLAHLLNNPQASRAVGNACGRNPHLLVVPCHRVLAKHQKLGGFSAGLPIKKALLHFEKIAYS